MRWPFEPIRVASTRRQEVSVGEDVEKSQPWCTVDVATTENGMGLPQKIKKRMAI